MEDEHEFVRKSMERIRQELSQKLEVKTVKVADLVKQLDFWIADCEKEEFYFFERGMAMSENCSAAKRNAYNNVKSVLINEISTATA